MFVTAKERAWLALFRTHFFNNVFCNFLIAARLDIHNLYPQYHRLYVRCDERVRSMIRVRMQPFLQYLDSFLIFLKGNTRNEKKRISYCVPNLESAVCRTINGSTNLRTRLYTGMNANYINTYIRC